MLHPDELSTGSAPKIEKLDSNFPRISSEIVFSSRTSATTLINPLSFDGSKEYSIVLQFTKL